MVVFISTQLELERKNDCSIMVISLVNIIIFFCMQVLRMVICTVSVTQLKRQKL